MSRRKLKSSTLSIFRWFCKNIAIVLGIIPQARRCRRTLTKRCNRRANILLPNKNIKSQLRQIDMCNRDKNTAEFIHLPLFNNNNNRSLDNLAYGDINVDQQRIICILAENQEITEWIQHLLEKNASVLKNSRIIDLQELIPFIQSSTHQDASTMTNTDHMCRSITSGSDLVTQSENARRLKALEFIRIFLENNEEDFCNYLINEEHLCQRKSFAIYQMIKQFLKVVYQSEHVQKQKTSYITKLSHCS